MDNDLILCLLSAAGVVALGGLAWFLKGIANKEITNNHYRKKGSIEVLGALLVAPWPACLFLKESKITFAFLFIAFASGGCRSGTLQVGRGKITKLIDSLFIK